MDGPALVAAVGADVVLIAIVPAVARPLRALHVVHRVEILALALVAVAHPVSRQARLIAGVVVLPVALVVAFLLVDLALVLPLLLDALEVGREEGVHVHDVVAVSGVAAGAGLVLAGVGGTEAEADEPLGRHADVLVAVGVSVPLGDFVTSLEFQGVVGNVRARLLLLLVEGTFAGSSCSCCILPRGLGKNPLAGERIGRDGTGLDDGRGRSSGSSDDRRGGEDRHGGGSSGGRWAHAHG